MAATFPLTTSVKPKSFNQYPETAPPTNSRYCRKINVKPRKAFICEQGIHKLFLNKANERTQLELVPSQIDQRTSNLYKAIKAKQFLPELNEFINKEKVRPLDENQRRMFLDTLHAELATFLDRDKVPPKQKLKIQAAFADDSKVYHSVLLKSYAWLQMDFVTKPSMKQRIIKIAVCLNRLPGELFKATPKQASHFLAMETGFINCIIPSNLRVFSWLSEEIWRPSILSYVKESSWLLAVINHILKNENVTKNRQLSSILTELKKIIETEQWPQLQSGYLKLLSLIQAQRNNAYQRMSLIDVLTAFTSTIKIPTNDTDEKDEKKT